MESFSVDELILLTSNLLILPGLLYMGVAGYRDSTEFSRRQRLEDRRQAPRRFNDRRPGMKDRRRNQYADRFNQRGLLTRRSEMARRKADRIIQQQLAPARESAA